MCDKTGNPAKTFAGEFQNPPAKYRSMPFWAWNSSLDQQELMRQIDCFCEMGFGGFYMHPRTGLATEYLGEDFLSCVTACVQKAGQKEMYACLYDEDRWPSGFAGGKVTQNPRYRAHHLLFTQQPYREEKGITPKGGLFPGTVRTENGFLLACYDIMRDSFGCLANYRRLLPDETVTGEKWYAYLETSNPDPWYNNQTYVDTLNKEAIDQFIQETYSVYQAAVGTEFGKRIPTIFTDEPQFSHKTTLRFPDIPNDVLIPWTTDFSETFQAEYGEDILCCLPELFWELPDGQVSPARYHYHDHVTQRFTEAFADNCGSWCRAHGLMLTGHMMEEPTLKSQTAALGETMRAYRAFDLPGVDILALRFEYTTVKQAVSASRQYGRQGVLSELYGVTGWSFDFRGYKIQGDWQAALGVTHRVPHLSLLSMEGEAKRDYPASISYQAPWHQEYGMLEDHYARIHVAMAQGKPIVRVGVIHPIESYWLHWGPSSQTSLIREEMDRHFQDLCEWLLFGSVDFDFVSESLLPQQCPSPTAPLSVGQMNYDVILVPGCETIRESTLQILNAYQKAGGTLIFLGKAPCLVDAVLDERPKKLWELSTCIPFERCSVLQHLESYRTVELKNANGEYTDNLLYQLRQDGETQWLFIAQGKEPQTKDVARLQELFITLPGYFSAECYHTITGEITPYPAEQVAGHTRMKAGLYQHDSLLLKLTDAKEVAIPCQKTGYQQHAIPIADTISVTLCEPNSLLLDRAEYALDNEEYTAIPQEILRIDEIIRQRLDFPSKRLSCAQPWTIPPQKTEHFVKLSFRFACGAMIKSVRLALEKANECQVVLDGLEIPIQIEDYYVDRAISVMPLADLGLGAHRLEIRCPFTQSGTLERCYLLGAFGVRVSGTKTRLIPWEKELGFGSLVHQGLPFYGGNITYHVPVEIPSHLGQAGNLQIHIPHYRGALISVKVDGEEAGKIVFAPYTLSLPVQSGKHQLDITLFGNRVNSFGAVHMVHESRILSPTSWRHTGDRWSDEYVLEEFGILSRPVLTWEI